MFSKFHEYASITEVVASIIALLAICATIFAALALNSEQAQVALVGLTGAVSSYFLTPKSNGASTNGERSKSVVQNPPVEAETKPAISAK